MQFELSDTQRDIQKAAKEFAEKEFDPDLSLELDRERKFPKLILEKACRLGFVGIDYPEEYGGQSLGLFENVLVTEEFCRKDSGIGISISLADMASGIILRHGNEQQKKQHLIPVTQGKAINTVALTDASHGENQTLAITKAEENPQGYRVNGKKSFVVNGSIASTFVTFCEVHPSADPVAKRVALIMEADQAGMVILERRKMMGMWMLPIHEVSFSDVIVQKDHLIGGEDNHVVAFLTERKIKTSAQALGIAQGALERTIKHAKTREQFGRRIIQFQGLQFMLAEMATQIEAARSLIYRTAWNWDTRSPNTDNLACMAKMFATDVAVRTTINSIQIHGGVGLMREYSIERLFRDAKTIQNLGEGNLLERARIAKIL